LVPESKDEVEKSARWNAPKEVNEFGPNGISNLLNYGDLDETNNYYLLLIVHSFKMSQPLGVKVYALNF